MPYLSVASLLLQDLLSGRFRFELPWFQRAYAWTEVQAGRLLHDLITACAEQRPHYVLGPIFLAIPAGAPKVSLIDGHQRLLTLTILFALLRDTLTDSKARQMADSAIASRSLGGRTTRRIDPQPNVAEFFATWVQQPGATLADPPGDIMQLTANERNILTNRNYLRAKLAKDLPDERARAALVRFMLERCEITVQSVPDEEEAWAIVSTQEETGLEFHSSERSKVTLISGMPRHEQEAVGRIYEHCQGLVGADNMCSLLDHIRAIKARTRSAKPIERDLMQRFRLDRGGLSFLEQEVRPRCELMARILRKQLADGATGRALAARTEPLSWLDNRHWMPPLLHWFSKFPVEHPASVRFVELVDRLAWVMRISAVDPTDQERRFLRLLAEIDRGIQPDEMKELAIEPDLQEDLMTNLRATSFFAKRFRVLVLRRISYNIDPSSEPGPADGSQVTVEHILPQSPRAGSTWWRSFPDSEAVGAYVNRLGNLTFLTLKQNQTSGQQDWPEKRKVLDASGFLLSTMAARENDTWTASTIDARSERMIAILLEPWGIATTPRAH
jgi:hypothetical protein